MIGLVKEMRFRDSVLVGALLLPPWTVLAVAVFWLFLDFSTPLRIDYEHAVFVDRPVGNRADAALHEISKAPAGAMVFLYREFCINATVTGVVWGRWQSDAVAWQAPVRPGLGLPPGCYKMSFPVVVPMVPPSQMVYIETRLIKINPLNIRRMEQAAIKLDIE